MKERKKEDIFRDDNHVLLNSDRHYLNIINISKQAMKYLTTELLLINSLIVGQAYEDFATFCNLSNHTCQYWSSENYNNTKYSQFTDSIKFKILKTYFFNKKPVNFK